MSTIDIKGLAALARIQVSDEELARLETELPNILQFVDTIQKLDVSPVPVVPVLRNVLRADGQPHESGKYTESLLAAAPAREGNRIAVKQVVSRKSVGGESSPEAT